MTLEVNLISFSAGRACWKRAANRLKDQALSSGRIEATSFYRPEDLTLTLGSLGADILHLAKEAPRGFGLWAWKLPLVYQALVSSERDTALLYLDAGSSLRWSEESKARFAGYVDVAMESNGLFFQQPLPESNWSKRSLRAIFPNDGDWRSGQVWAGGFLLRNNDYTREVIREMIKLSVQNSFEILRDPNPIEVQDSEFIAHRHDQSLLSLTVKDGDFSIIPDETYFGPNWEEDGVGYPIWASRLCSGNPDLEYSVAGRIRRQLERRLPF